MIGLLVHEVISVQTRLTVSRVRMFGTLMHTTGKGRMEHNMYCLNGICIEISRTLMLHSIHAVAVLVKCFVLHAT